MQNIGNIGGWNQTASTMHEKLYFVPE